MVARQQQGEFFKVARGLWINTNKSSYLFRFTQLIRTKSSWTWRQPTTPLISLIFVFSSFHFLFQVSYGFIDFTQISTSYVVSFLALVGPVNQSLLVVWRLCRLSPVRTKKSSQVCRLLPVRSGWQALVVHGKLGYLSQLARQASYRAACDQITGLWLAEK